MKIDFTEQPKYFTYDNEAWYASSFKPEYISYILNYEPNVIFEFGSFNGGDALKYKLGFPKSEVYTFEASPTLFKSASRTKKYGVKCFNYAISNYDGNTSFYKSLNLTTDEEVGGGSLLKVTDEIKRNTSTGIFSEKPDTIKCITISTFCKQHNITNIDFMHIDVEGVSKEVIEGFGTIRPKLIFVELILTEFSHIGGSKSKEVEEMLFNMGYEFLATNGNDNLYKLKELK